ncbi:hypothetical protein Avbf_09736 [Armadillidium vulgare]|nr:hypothetical protein Avbf_09736 [Armadillidium vulgare]
MKPDITIYLNAELLILPRFKNKKFVTMSDVFVDNKPKNIFCYKHIVGICKSTCDTCRLNYRNLVFT